MPLKAYTLFDREAGPQEGAALVFAHSTAEARRLGWPVVNDWFDTEWIHFGVRWLRKDAEWLADQEGVDLEGEPKVIESPKFCQRCELWGNAPLNADRICEHCRDNEGGE